MRILHLICYFNDNLDYQENRLIELQKKNSHDVCLITSDRFYPFKDYNNNYAKILGRRIIPTKNYQYRGVKIIRKKTLFELQNHSQSFFFNLLDIIKFSPDVIHIHNCGIYNFISSFFYAYFFNKKIFIDCHQDKFNTKDGLFNIIHYFLWRIILKLFQKKISLFLPINVSSKKYLISKFHINEKKIKISPLGINCYNKKSIKYKKNLCEKLKIKKNEFLIVNSGKQNESKKIIELIELIKILNRKKFNCKLLLIGNSDNDYRKKLENKIRFANLVLGHNKIINIKFQNKDKLIQYLELADIAIWPGLPSITIQEAMYANNLIILPKESASSNLINSELLYFENNLQFVAKKIISFFLNKTLLSKVKYQNKQTSKQLDWKIINTQLEHYYEKY